MGVGDGCSAPPRRPAPADPFTAACHPDGRADGTSRGPPVRPSGVQLASPHDRSPHRLAPPPRRRGRRRLPLPGAGSGRARRLPGRPVPQARRGRGPARGHVAGAAGRQGHAVQVPPPSRGARLRAWLARRVGTSVLLPMLLAEEGREVKGYLQLHDATPDGPVAPTALRLAQESKEHARGAGAPQRPGGRALAPDRRRRLPPQRRLRLQRRAHRQLRPRGGDDRRPGEHGDREPRRGGRRSGGHGGRRALDGSLGLSRRQERARGVRARDRDGAGGDPAHARARARGAEPAVPGQGHPVRAGRGPGHPGHERSRRGRWTRRFAKSSGSARRAARRCARPG